MTESGFVLIWTFDNNANMHHLRRKPFPNLKKINTQTAIGYPARTRFPCRLFVLCLFTTTRTEPTDTPSFRTRGSMAGCVSSCTSRNYSPTLFAKNLTGVFAVGQKQSEVYSKKRNGIAAGRQRDRLCAYNTSVRP